MFKFNADLNEAITLGQELATLILKGKLRDDIPLALDKALWVAGVTNAYFAGQSTATNTETDMNLEALAKEILSEQPSAQGIPVVYLLAMAKKIICSLP